MPGRRARDRAAKTGAPAEPRPLDNDGRAAYERQTYETEPAWEAFQHYRDDPDSTVRTTAHSLGKSATLIGEWSSDHRWVERRAAWLAEQDRIRRARVAQAVGTMAHRHVVLAQQIQSKVLERLASVTPADVAAMSWQELARLTAEAARLERLALGEPTDLPGAPREPARESLEGAASAVEQAADPARLAKVMAALATALDDDTPSDTPTTDAPGE